MKVNGNRVWTITTDHSIGLGGERKTETLANELTKVLDKNNIKNLVKYSDYRVTVEVFDFSSMCTVAKTIDTLMEKGEYKLTGIEIKTSTY